MADWQLHETAARVSKLEAKIEQLEQTIQAMTKVLHAQDKMIHSLHMRSATLLPVNPYPNLNQGGDS
jgi:uncharacterized coiled-coil protein SlyX